MDADKVNARIIGALFVITMIAGGIDAYYASPILHAALENVYPHAGRVITGALLVVVMSLGVVGIAIAFYPVLRRQSEAIALTYVGFRIIECVLLILGAVCSLCLIPLSREFISAGAPAESFFTVLAALMIKARYTAYQIAMIVLGIGSMMLCYLMYQARLVPRWLSGWGFLGYVLLFVSAPLDLLGVIDTIKGEGALLYIPGGIWEFIAFPAWLIVKGFDTSAVATKEGI